MANMTWNENVTHRVDEILASHSLKRPPQRLHLERIQWRDGARQRCFICPKALYQK